MSTARRLTIGWKVSALGPQVASVRYRALLPLLALEQGGVECRIFSDRHGVDLGALDALVIVKGLSLQDRELAQSAFARQVPIVLDLCDNIFVGAYGEAAAEFGPTPADNFAAIARLASAIVVSTEPLAELVRLHCGDSRNVIVIPDGVESSAQFRAASARLAAARLVQRRRIVRIAIARLRHSMARLQDFGWLAWTPIVTRWTRIAEKAARANGYELLRKRVTKAIAQAVPEQDAGAQPSAVEPLAPAARQQILWFGIHGAEHASFGMLDLLLVREDLEQIAREFDVELVVVSNNRPKFERHITPFKIRSRYLEWTPSVMEQQLRSAALVVVPNSLDPFSLCKSANRTVLALTAGVPVVATLTPALRPLSGCIRTGSFLDGMRSYLSDADRAAHDVRQGRALIDAMFGSARLASMWLDVLNDVVRMARTSTPAAAARLPDAELVVALQLVMDFDLAFPVIRKAQDMGIAVLVLCNSEMRGPRPDVETVLRQHCRQYLFVHRTVLDRTFMFPASAKALLTFSESSLRPHAFCHQLTRMANRAGLATYTAQHGFENVGLTYDDAIQPARKIAFAARHVFIWGGLETLHPSVPPATRRKCIPMGCPKPAQAPRTPLPETLPPNGRVVGIFENLHWKRYPEHYRKAFIGHVLQLAADHPDVLFLIKPHNAGLWLTKRYQGTLPSLPNIVVADPKSPQWSSSTASGLFWRCEAVITTPSTVALDAARHGLPVAVVAESLALDNYAPLTLLREAQDWHCFVGDAAEPGKRRHLLDLAQAFLRRVVLPDGAELRMVQAMLPRDAGIARATGALDLRGIHQG